MLNFDLKKKINSLRDILVGKVPDPKAQVEQITIAMIYKFMDDMDLEGAALGERKFFVGEYEKYAWSNLMLSENSGQERAYLYSEGIEKMALNGSIPQLFRDIFKGAYLPYRDPQTLNLFLKEINEFKYDNSEDLGNAFEYLLSIMGSQGDAGQFRTPRHIIDMIVEIVDPKKNETIIDPACGTAGFLISAYKHILEKNKDDDGNTTLTNSDKKMFTENFTGYDISPDMIRLARVNLYLHGFIKPQIYEYDTLTSEDRWQDNFDVILANPPFMTPKGGINPHNRFRIRANRAEVLFVDYIMEHLNPNGRAGIIVPEGIVFQSGNAYKDLRKYLINEGLYAVVSLPSGVFQPYSGVKTSILFIDKKIAKPKNEILFVKVNNDGFDLGAQRREIKQNDIPTVIELIKQYQQGETILDNELVIIASKKQIEEEGYNLVGDRYKVQEEVSSEYPMVELGEVCDILRGGTITKKDAIEGGVPVVAGGQKPAYYHNTSNRQGNIITISGSGAYAGFVNFYNTPIYASDCTTIQSNNDNINLIYIYNVLKNIQNKIYDLQSGMGQPHVYAKDIMKIKIPLPPINIQEQIVNEIENYQKIIDGAKQVVDNYKPSIKIDDSWNEKCLKKLSNRITKGTTPTTIGYDFENEGINFIKIENIYANGEIRTNNMKYISSTCNDAMQRSQLKENDILISIAGALGRVAIVRKNILPANTNQALCIISLNECEIFAEYLFYYIRSGNLNRYIENKKTGVAQNNLSLAQIGEIEIKYPKIEDQIQLVKVIQEEENVINENKKLIKIFEQKINCLINNIWNK